jgi:hypothetical protein
MADYTGIYNLCDRKKGDTFEKITFTITNTITGLPISLVGATIFCQFKSQARGTAKLDLSIGAGITVDNAANGVFSIDQIDVLYLDAGVYLYDIEIRYSDGVRKTNISGSMTVLQDITEVVV